VRTNWEARQNHSTDRIHSSHVGRLSPPAGFEDIAARLPAGEVGDPEVEARVVPVVAEVVKRQVDIGIDCIGDGEYWSAIGSKSFDQQMTGLTTRPLQPGEVGAMRESTRERDVIRILYADMDRVGTMACVPGERPIRRAAERVIVSGPVNSKGTAATARQLTCFKAAIARRGRGGRSVRPRARAGLARPFHLQRAIQDRRGIRLRVGQRDERQIPRDR
jgi:hypothetical protein